MEIFFLSFGAPICNYWESYAFGKTSEIVVKLKMSKIFKKNEFREIFKLVSLKF